jgi:hypothetical protein
VVTQKPLASCAYRFDSGDTLEDLWDHCATPDHETGVYDQNHHPCGPGCAMGFPDPMSQQSHQLIGLCIGPVTAITINAQLRPLSVGSTAADDRETPEMHWLNGIETTTPCSSSYDPVQFKLLPTDTPTHHNSSRLAGLPWTEALVRTSVSLRSVVDRLTYVGCQMFGVWFIRDAGVVASEYEEFRLTMDDCGLLCFEEYCSPTALCKAYRKGKNGYYMTCIYRQSGIPGKRTEEQLRKTRDKLIRHSTKFARYLRETGQIYGRITLVAIHSHATKSALHPSFAGALELEFDLSSHGIALSRASAIGTMATGAQADADHAARFTKVIGAHIINALSGGQTPIIVSNGVKAFSTDFARIQVYMDLMSKQFGEIPFIIRHPTVAETDDLRLICPESDGTSAYGVYTPACIVNARSEGVGA